MAERLAVIRQAPADWLDWGGFVGGGAPAVARALPQARRIVVEPDAVLRQRSVEAARGPWPTRWWPPQRRAAEAAVLLEAAVPAGAAGMVWANMALHAAADPPALLARWHDALAVGGFLMFSTLGPDTLRELAALYAGLGWPAPHPGYVDMHDIGDALLQAGFADPVMDQETVRLDWSAPDALLAELRQWGGNVGRDRFAGLRTPRWRRRLLDALAERADAQGRIALSFEIVYGHAYKTGPRAVPGAPVTIGLDAVRAALAARRHPAGG